MLVGAKFICQRNKIRSTNHQSLGYAIAIISSIAYLFYAGFYDELPSDVYKHLEHFKNISNQIEAGKFKSFNDIDIFSKSVQYWYHLPTLIANLLRTSFLQNIEVFAAINVIVLLICIYEFAYWLFEKAVSNRTELLFLSLLSVFFFATHFGINVFAFIRYYAIAPTILNYAIYLTAVVCFYKYFRFEFKIIKFLLVSGLLFFTAYLIHAQEAMFIGTIYFLITIVVLLKNKTLNLVSDNDVNQKKPLPNSLVPLAAIGFIFATAFYFYVINSVPIGRVIRPKVIPLTDLINAGENYFVLNPYVQFYTVLIHWGFYIYILYIVFYKKYFTNQSFLLASMLIPVLTVFNPFFTDFFLRIGYSDVLWRFLYMLPLYFVAARLTTALCFATEKIIRRFINILIVLLMFVLLLPINFGSVNLPYSRIYSLGQPHHQAQPSYWQDLLDYLQGLPEKEVIITDPVTGYMITALTKHENRRYKFYTRRIYDPYIFDDYTDHPLKKYAGKLLIINQRKGISTKTAKIARHWNPHTLKLTEYYNDKLLKHIEEETNHFEAVWHADDIDIYRINY